MTLSPPHTHSQAFACGSPGRAPAPPPPAASGIRQPGPRSRRHSRSESRPTARRHVILPKHVSKNAPKGRLLSESEWRGLGVQQSRGWVHYAIHRCAHRPTREPICQMPRRCCPRTPAASPRRAVPPTCLRAPCDTHTRLYRAQQLDPHLSLSCVVCARVLTRRPEPHILLFRRPQGTDPTTGLVHGKRIDPATGKVVG